MTESGGQETPRHGGQSDPALVDRIWGQRIAELEGGYTEAYNAERKVDERLVDRVLSKQSASGLALDVGTFYPETAKRLAKMGWTVVCADLSEEVCRRVRSLAVEEGLGLWPVQCDGSALPFRACSFDLVTDFVTSVVTPSATAVVTEEIRVLKPKAFYVLVSNNRWTRSGRMNLRRQRNAGGRHPRWGYFSPLSPYDLLSFTWKYRLELVGIDSEVYSFDAVGLWRSVLGRRLPWIRRVLGWRLGAAYVAQSDG